MASLQEHGVLAVAGGDRLEGGGGVALGAPGAHEPAGEAGLADAGVGAGDEEAGHGGRVKRLRNEERKAEKSGITSCPIFRSTLQFFV